MMSQFVLQTVCTEFKRCQNSPGNEYRDRLHYGKCRIRSVSAASSLLTLWRCNIKSSECTLICHKCIPLQTKRRYECDKKHILTICCVRMVQRNDPGRMDLDISVIRAACQLTLHADYITDCRPGSHKLCVKEVQTGSPYITTHYSAHLLNLTHSGELFQREKCFSSNPNTLPCIPIPLRPYPATIRVLVCHSL